MKKESREYDVQKRAKAGTAATARAAVALYVAWLGVKILRGMNEGGSTVPPAVSWIAGLTFIAAALAFCFYIWKRWRTDLEAARLPEEIETDTAGSESPDT